MSTTIIFQEREITTLSEEALKQNMMDQPLASDGPSYLRFSII